MRFDDYTAHLNGQAVVTGTRKAVEAGALAIAKGADEFRNLPSVTLRITKGPNKLFVTAKTIVFI
jgi:hypothetical protein